MVDALWITLVGMSLVFVAILLLWGMMALLVRLTASHEQPVSPPLQAPVDPAAGAGSSSIPEASLAFDRKRQAAAAAVAAALALQKNEQGAGSLPPRPGQPSAWQAAQRAGWLGRQADGFRNKVTR